MAKAKKNTMDSSSIDLSGTHTGRILMSMPESMKTASGLRALKRNIGLQVSSSSDYTKQRESTPTEGDGIFLEKLGIAILDPHGDTDLINKIRSTRSLGTQMAVFTEPERVVHAITDAAYNKGFQDALKSLKSKLGMTNLELDAPEFEDYKNLLKTNTWGLLKTRVVPGPSYQMKYTGKNIRLCVLDTGIDFLHPDFKNRAIPSASFVPNQLVQDKHGHGTHCAGTAVGILHPTDKKQTRYSVAYDSKLYVGKVLNNAGSGADGWILAGINWALSQKCEVISMSIGGMADSEGYSAIYEQAANKALEQGSLIIAAAGNSYPSSPAVNHPANCPSILSVAAVDEKLVKASFSCVGKYPPGGKVDIAGPGVKVLSSVSKPHNGLTEIAASLQYGFLNGTSMATPHVAGIAALYAQQRKTNRGAKLWQKLVSNALPLNQQVIAVGAGLVQAPVSKKKK